MHTAIHFPENFRLRTPRGLRTALEVVAKQRHTTPSEWARQALLRALETEGVRLPQGGEPERAAA